MRPISYYWSSQNYTMSAVTEQWLERLPLADKITLATAILDQCKPAFCNMPTKHLAVLQLPNLNGDTAS